MRCLTIGFGDGWDKPSSYTNPLYPCVNTEIFNCWMSGLNHTAHFSNMFVLRTVLIYLCRRIQNCKNIANSWIQYTPDQEIRLRCVQRAKTPFIVKSQRKNKIYIQNSTSGLYFRQKQAYDLFIWGATPHPHNITVSVVNMNNCLISKQLFLA
jgi:hypothetical protein